MIIFENEKFDSFQIFIARFRSTKILNFWFNLFKVLLFRKTWFWMKIWIWTYNDILNSIWLTWIFVFDKNVSWSMSQISYLLSIMRAKKWNLIFFVFYSHVYVFWKFKFFKSFLTSSWNFAKRKSENEFEQSF